MVIKYTGPKPSKRIEWGGKVYIFDPTCVVVEKDLLLFLLHPDRKGLFEGDVSKPLHEGAIPKEAEALKPEPEKKLKRRARKKKE